MQEPLRPARVCEGLLRALDASEGRRRRRQRNTTPDALGLGIKRSILEDAIRADPDPEDFEAWLLARCQGATGGGDTASPETPSSGGAVYAMARTVLEEWSLARSSAAFRDWLSHGAPSDDAAPGDPGPAPRHTEGDTPGTVDGGGRADRGCIRSRSSRAR